MSQPLGTSIGNRLGGPGSTGNPSGQGREDIAEFICRLAQLVLDLANVEISFLKSERHLTNGATVKR